jgi:hypothetical protein
MNDRQRIRLAQAVTSRADLVAKILDTVEHGSTVMGRMRELQGNLRARSYEGPGSTMRHDTVFAGMKPDQAVADERDLDKALKAAAVELTKATVILNRYPTPKRVSARQRRDLGLVTEPGCESCARTEGPAGGPRWVAPHPKIRRPSTVGGRLPVAMLLCRWCWECVSRWGRLPTTEEIELYHRTGRVPWPNDVRSP